MNKVEEACVLVENQESLRVLLDSKLMEIKERLERVVVLSNKDSGLEDSTVYYILSDSDEDLFKSLVVNGILRSEISIEKIEYLLEKYRKGFKIGIGTGKNLEVLDFFFSGTKTIGVSLEDDKNFKQYG